MSAPWCGLSVNISGAPAVHLALGLPGERQVTSLLSWPFPSGEPTRTSKLQSWWGEDQAPWEPEASEGLPEGSAGVPAAIAVNT